MNILRKDNGFSLVEVMVVVVIFTIILTAVYAVLFAGEKDWRICNNKIQLQQNLRNTLDIIADELRQSAASRVVISNGGQAITFSIPIQLVGAADDETITLEASGGFPEETIDLSNPDPGAWGIRRRLEQTQDSQVSYLISDDEIIRRALDAAGNATEEFIIARNIDALLFTRNAPGSDWITIQVEATQETVKQFPIRYSLITSIHCENSNF